MWRNPKPLVQLDGAQILNLSAFLNPTCDASPICWWLVGGALVVVLVPCFYPVLTPVVDLTCNRGKSTHGPRIVIV
ncbi:hypothetical protein BJX63DRAFT_403133 [Aspergillus granulosus]|uniref:Uncharacterized protein n=1 Tax=Aspergillus granulosus TaxID=176169 RepID=A0ABR4H3Q1_9EURO